MAQTPTTYGTRLAAVIEERRGRKTYRELSSETHIPLTTLHRRLTGDGFTLAELDRLARALHTTPSALMAEAESGAA